MQGEETDLVAAQRFSGVFQGAQRCGWPSGSGRISWPLLGCLAFRPDLVVPPPLHMLESSSRRPASPTPSSNCRVFQDQNPVCHEFDPRRYFYFNVHRGISWGKIATQVLRPYMTPRVFPPRRLLFADSAFPTRNKQPETGLPIGTKSRMHRVEATSRGCQGVGE